MFRMRRLDPSDCYNFDYIDCEPQARICGNCKHWDRAHPVYTELGIARCHCLKAAQLPLAEITGNIPLRDDYNPCATIDDNSESVDLWEPDEGYLDGCEDIRAYTKAYRKHNSR